jgi:type IV pilus assembly protein PilW
MTLIEVLISLVIGLVVVGAVIVSFVGSGKAGRYQSALNQMNQDAQFGLNLLSREIELAGYVSPSQSLGSLTPLFGCDGATGAIPFDPTATTLVCGNSGTTNVSAFEVVYEADINTTVPVTVGSVQYPSNCLGDRLAAVGSIYIARNRYFIDTATGTNASGRPELYCASPASANNSGTYHREPVMENVDDLQVSYGVALPETYVVIRYAKAGKDSTTVNTVNAQPAGEWNNVMAVRICLLMRSAEPVLTGEDTRTYLDCNSQTKTSTDNYLRRAYVTTATVRSKMAP